MITEKMGLFYSVLKEEGFELSSASYEKDEYHIFYKSGLVLTIDLSTDKYDATMMYFDVNHEFVSYTYDLETSTSFDDLLEHVLNVISTNSMLLKWNLTLYEIIHLDKLIFLSKRDLNECTSSDNLSAIKIDRLMNLDEKLFDMLLGSSNENNQITLLYNKLSSKGFKIVLVQKTNTGMSNITRALFLKNGVLIPMFYEESGIVLCGDIYFETSSKITDNLYIDDASIVSKFSDNDKTRYLYRLKFSDEAFDDLTNLMDNTNIVYTKLSSEACNKVNLSKSIEYLTTKFNKNLYSISSELSKEKTLQIKA